MVYHIGFYVICCLLREMSSTKNSEILLSFKIICEAILDTINVLLGLKGELSFFKVTFFSQDSRFMHFLQFMSIVKEYCPTIIDDFYAVILLHISQ